MSSVRLRKANRDDSAAIARLLDTSADSGRVGIGVSYQVNVFDAITARGNTWGVVAEHSTDGIVGVGFVKLIETGIYSSPQQCAYLFSLCVHPDWRGRGIGKQLATWRIGHIKELFGEDVLLLAGTQAGNQRSKKVASLWAEAFYDGVIMISDKVKQSTHKQTAGLFFRIAHEADYSTIAQNEKLFYEDYYLFKSSDASQIEDWLAPSLVHPTHRHYYVIENRVGEIVAGARVAEEYRIRTMVVKRLPAIMRLLNRFTKVIPPSNQIRALSVSNIWHRPNQEKAVKLLWDSLAYEWRDSADILTFQCDAKSPLLKIIKPPIWLPTGKIEIAASKNLFQDSSRLIYPPS